VDDSDVICGHRTVSDTLGHDLVTSNQDHRYLVNKSSRVVPPIQRGLHVSNLPGAWNQPERRHQSGAGQRLQRGLLVWVEIDHTTGGTEEHGDDTVATGAPPGDAAVAIHVQYAHAHSFRSRPAAITISQGTDTFLVPESSREIYSHGHHDSVLRSHRWRTAENSAAYLLPRLNNADRLLDVGIGPGTITLDLAERLSEGWVVGVDSAPAAVAATRALARAQGVNNLRLMVGDAYQLAFADASFDVVHAHQLVQHLAHPVTALREMRRVCVPGGLVAIRDADYSGMTWHPPSAALTRWLELYQHVARSNGGEPDAGRRLLAWAHAAGFSDVDSSASAWCFARPADIAWWSDSWAERLSHSDFAQQAVEQGLSDRMELAQLAEGWRRWGKLADAWFAVLHGEILCRR
jgi:ubiquinone/menaquinone biosynthesis C-methylase UbiE